MDDFLLARYDLKSDIFRKKGTVDAHSMPKITSNSNRKPAKRFWSNDCSHNPAHHRSQVVFVTSADSRLQIVLHWTSEVLYYLKYARGQ